MMARSDGTNVALSAAAIVCTVLVTAPGRAQAQEHPAAPPDAHGSTMQVTPLERGLVVAPGREDHAS
jgi:hypothetical protein